MNKYYIAWPLPSAFCKAALHAQTLVEEWLTPETKRTALDELHITALYLGKMPQSQAIGVMSTVAGMHPIEAQFGDVEVFSNRQGPHALVIKLKDLTGAMCLTHESMKRTAGVRTDFAFNPHVTLAKSDGFSDPGLRKAADVLNINYKFSGAGVELNQIALYEKVEGGSYKASYIYDSCRLEEQA